MQSLRKQWAVDLGKSHHNVVVPGNIYMAGVKGRPEYLQLDTGEVLRLSGSLRTWTSYGQINQDVWASMIEAAASRSAR